ncbi:unnamed protein product [Aphanomyces euteiches]|uniref:NAD(P)-binding protein n=1 Tax=Aphanomyces euteiches TaxID=100861 RepID=A0A6G0WRL5_9STRA|nr:hypothetical protein Ae201684_012466 [Aphanomyces euteiches]KAH9090288.1 hypothetical protein Ae201684P_014095 [Aphanomyces euteiches]KAH9141852.1 hypothetical protein AeRB84_014018 [Aphanomyces euteiches]
MVFSSNDIPDQRGRVAIVTGGTAGLGYESVLQLARKGCHVIFTTRSTARGEETLERIKAALAPEPFQVEYAVANNEDLQSISAFAESFLACDLPLHLLLLNAGVCLVPYRVIHGVESTLFINHVAHHHLATLLLPALERSAPSQIVVVTSSAHATTNSLDLELPTAESYNSVIVYRVSKLANILMVHGLLKQIKSPNVFVNSVHPVVVATEIFRAGVQVEFLPWFIRGLAKAVIPIVHSACGYSSDEGALTQLYVSTSPDVAKNEWQGQYFVPIAKLDKSSELSRDPEQAERLWKWTTDVIATVLAETNKVQD